MFSSFWRVFWDTSGDVVAAFVTVHIHSRVFVVPHNQNDLIKTSGRCGDDGHSLLHFGQ